MNRGLLIAPLVLVACSTAPDFTPPDMQTPQAYKEQAPYQEGAWQEAVPLADTDRGRWWKLFGDGSLEVLEAEAVAANPSLQAAAARVEQARATLRANNSTLFPKIDLGGGVRRSQPSSAGVSAFGGNPSAQLNPYTIYSAGATASYEVDLFGRVRDGEKAYAADAKAQESLYQSMVLALQADVAQHYFTLRALDSERALLRGTITVREEARRIMQKRLDLGEAGEIDVSRTEADLTAIQAELLVLDNRRAAVEHALAVLLGKNPSGFSFVEAPLTLVPPRIPADLPSALLARRPDMSAALSAMAAANARIGVARTAFLPRLLLSASAGAESLTVGDLFQWSSRTWTLGQLAGDALSMTLFDSGRNLARLALADAAYEEAVANYRAQALVAFREVEDALAAQRLLAAQEIKTGMSAVSAARAEELVQRRYDEGEVAYFEVVDAQRNALAAARADIQTRGQRFLTTVSLVRALGGGWDYAALHPAEAGKVSFGDIPLPAAPAPPEAISPLAP